MAQMDLTSRKGDDALTLLRTDHFAISQMVTDGASVLDVGCAEGGLMRLLSRECGARVRGLDVDPACVRICVSRGLSVVQADADTELAEYPTGAFDYVVFSHTLLGLRRPQEALTQAARIGGRVIVSIRNAGRWSRRSRALGGRIAHWDPDALHQCSVRDLVELARSARLSVERATPISRGVQGAPFAKTLWRANLFAEEAVFLLAP